MPAEFTTAVASTTGRPCISRPLQARCRACSPSAFFAISAGSKAINSPITVTYELRSTVPVHRRREDEDFLAGALRFVLIDRDRRLRQHRVDRGRHRNHLAVIGLGLVRERARREAARRAWPALADAAGAGCCPRPAGCPCAAGWLCCGCCAWSAARQTNRSAVIVLDFMQSILPNRTPPRTKRAAGTLLERAALKRKNNNSLEPSRSGLNRQLGASSMSSSAFWPCSRFSA